MGLFDLFKPREREEPDPFGAWSGPTLPAAPVPSGPVRRPSVDPFLEYRVGPEPPPGPQIDPFQAWASAPEPRSIEEALITPEARAEVRAPLYREEPSPYRPAPVRREIPAARSPYDPEAFARRLPEMFDLPALFSEVESIRASRAFRAQVDESTHTGEPAVIGLGRITFGDPWTDLSRLFGVPPEALSRDLELLFDMTTAAFELVKPDGMPGWFRLEWAPSGNEVDLVYLEVKYRPGMSGIWDVFREWWTGKKSGEERGLIQPAPTLPSGPVDPFSLYQAEEEPTLPAPSGEVDPFLLYQAEEGARGMAPYAPPPSLPAAIDPFQVLAPAPIERRGPELPIESAFIPPEERMVRRGEEFDPFSQVQEELPGFQMPAMAPEPERGAPIPSGPPEEVSRGGKRYYLPTTVGQIADRMLEMYGADGLRRIWDAIHQERETPEWRLAYHEYALNPDRTEPPSMELEHMSVHTGPSEIELYSEFFNIPLELLMSYVDMEDPEEMNWEALNEEILWPLFYDIVPRAWEILLPGLPGKIIVDSSDSDGCPALKYVETPPEGFRTDQETVDRLEQEVHFPYNRPKSPEMAPTASFERGEPEEVEEETPPPPKKKKKKKK